MILGKPHRAFMAFDIKKSACETLNFRNPLAFLEGFKRDPWEWRNSVVITFDGYNYDPRPTWDIPQCVKYYQELEKAFPFLLAFVRYNPAQEEMRLWGLDMYIKMMMIDHKIGAKHPYAMMLDFKQLVTFMTKKLLELRDLFPDTPGGKKQYDDLHNELLQSFSYWIEKNQLIPNK